MIMQNYIPPNAVNIAAFGGIFKNMGAPAMKLIGRKKELNLLMQYRNSESSEFVAV